MTAALPPGRRSTRCTMKRMLCLILLCLAAGCVTPGERTPLKLLPEDSAPLPRRGRKCPHCREPVVVRKAALLTPANAAALDQKKSAPPSDAPPEPAPRLAHFKVFRSALNTWDTLFAEAAEFVTEVGPDR